MICNGFALKASASSACDIFVKNATAVFPCGSCKGLSAIRSFNEVVVVVTRLQIIRFQFH
ncbi:hypothetical protein CN558_21235 [Bacillus wiedmannii]|uniref:Uncharacterized protein n=1 Tax=Bacillus wiedmannii TaxID=1890302 RepID=A0A2A8CHK0_9BACI|nr:hypothetical protein CN690_12860 [Bacillus wiedmannii]PEM34348.1 hypothetical protein CN598_01810 [Bacillus wiedmannii]PEM86084.1 hypothetical protein CN627_18030 [Bacillus wiedmannii]PEO83774.1 hypothetical protein CN558_21235 [Bacillus wiedmannii]PEP28308.1 hypothetical protein CN566_15175 [Bacillus wiedmannii]